MFNDSSDFSSTFLATGSSYMPFSEIQNNPSASPSRLHRSRRPENVFPWSPPKGSWMGVSDEDKVLDDMGIEDPEDEAQLEVFNSIPGFDDHWDEEENAEPAAETSHCSGYEEEQTHEHATYDAASVADSEEDFGDVQADEEGDSSDLSSVTGSVDGAQEESDEESERSDPSSATSSDSEPDESDEELEIELDHGGMALGGDEDGYEAPRRESSTNVSEVSSQAKRTAS
ncbi:hypothetical protein C8Q73DRAFT_788996 [Cubamyces lactineus]|nr:hypothetical protein C8Q73DRAFT_788996 [Cubamyces lactineus]